jgi:hypothetical protein
MNFKKNIHNLHLRVKVTIIWAKIFNFSEKLCPGCFFGSTLANWKKAFQEFSGKFIFDFLFCIIGNEC